MSPRPRAGNSPTRGIRAVSDAEPRSASVASPAEPQAQADRGHKGWVEIILSVKSVLAFSALVVLVTDSALFGLVGTLNNSSNQIWLIALAGLILMSLIGTIVLLALKRPEALGIERASSPHFATLLGSRTYSTMAPYLSNLPPGDVVEALDWFELKMANVERDQSSEERDFQNRFAISFVRQGRDLLG